jgi:hypothetical protein
MTVVTATVWLDYFKGRLTPATECLDQLLGVEMLVMADLVLAQVLPQVQHDPDNAATSQLLASIPVVQVGGLHIALKASENIRQLHHYGHPHSPTLDSLIATYCIEHQYRLLFSEAIYHPFVQHLGLRAHG